MGGAVVIHDVGPRDGLQNQPRVLSPLQRLDIIAALVKAGVKHIQVAAFVSPRAVPAMAGAAEIVAGVNELPGRFDVLVPNFKGYQLASEAGASEVEMVLYASDGMAQANAGMGRAEAEAVCGEIIDSAAKDGVAVTATISVAFECPFDGPVAPQRVIEMTGRLFEGGVRRVVVADTIGAADPAQVSGLMGDLVSRFGTERLACHFHDTRAMGLANVFAALQCGVRRFDASIAGVGGCPFAPGASGNVATEDVAMMLGQMGYETGIDLQSLLRAAELVRELTGTTTGGRARAWLEQSLAKSA